MDKKFCGSARERQVQTKDGNQFTVYNIWLSPDDIKSIVKNQKESGISLNMLKKKETSENGVSHYIVIDEYEKPSQKPATVEDFSEDDLPF